MRPSFASVVVSSLVAAALAAPAQAAFPGAVGKLAFHTPTGIWVLDGTGRTQLTSGYQDRDPAWPPDGSKIAFTTNREHPGTGPTSIYLMNPDGSGMTPVTSDYPKLVSSPAWSADGQRIVYSRHDSAQHELVVMNADGTGKSVIRSSTGGLLDDPAWSPDGVTIAFVQSPNAGVPDSSDLWVMNPDGTGAVRLTNDLANDTGPNWSPSGDRIAFARDVALDSESQTCCPRIFTIKPDGSTLQQWTETSSGFYLPREDRNPAWSPDGQALAYDHVDPPSPGYSWRIYSLGTGPSLSEPTTIPGKPDWQPLPGATPYEHPQSATQVQLALVPTFKQCGTSGNPSNSEHAAPLGTQSCNPPQPASAVAVFGTLANGFTSYFASPGDTEPLNGSTASASFGIDLDDVQTTTGGDYDPASGADMTAVARLRFTDRASGWRGVSATAEDYDFAVPVDCVPTAGTSTGSRCSASTSFGNVLPGLIREGNQTLVQVFRVRLNDAGANGVRGDSDDHIFATEGIFAP
jgi:Tol biopolymer transport system component